MKLFLVAVLVCLFPSFSTLAEDSSPVRLYDLSLDLETQNGTSIHLSSFAGKRLVISMFYTSCDYACPLLINNIKTLVRNLEKDGGDVRVLLVSLDPQTDTPARLKDAATKHKLRAPKWTLARSSASDVENLAAVLGIKYKKNDTKTINHTSVITVVTPDGRFSEQRER